MTASNKILIKTKNNTSPHQYAKIAFLFQNKYHVPASSADKSDVLIHENRNIAIDLCLQCLQKVILCTEYLPHMCSGFVQGGIVISILQDAFLQKHSTEINQTGAMFKTTRDTVVVLNPSSTLKLYYNVLNVIYNNQVFYIPVVNLITI